MMGLKNIISSKVTHAQKDKTIYKSDSGLSLLNVGSRWEKILVQQKTREESMNLERKEVLRE